MTRRTSSLLTSHDGKSISGSAGLAGSTGAHPNEMQLGPDHVGDRPLGPLGVLGSDGCNRTPSPFTVSWTTSSSGTRSHRACAGGWFQSKSDAAPGLKSKQTERHIGRHEEDP